MLDSRDGTGTEALSNPSMVTTPMPYVCFGTGTTETDKQALAAMAQAFGTTTCTNEATGYYCVGFGTGGQRVALLSYGEARGIPTTLCETDCC
jgi:hypothetical protein